MLVFPKKQEPTNREASQVIGRWIAPLPCWADMLRVRRRCAQTAHISLQISCFQRAIFRQNFQRALFPSASSKASSSDFPNVYQGLRLRFSPSPSLFRFGEAVFTVGRWKPQGQKTQTVTFFSCLSISLRNLGVDENFGTSEPLFAQHCCGHLGRLGQIGADPTLGSTTRQGAWAGLLGNAPRFLWSFSCADRDSALSHLESRQAGRIHHDGIRHSATRLGPRRSRRLTDSVFCLTC